MERSLFPPEKFEKEETKEIKESTTDPESGYYVKDERTKQFAYSFHAASDRNGFVLGTIVTPGNTHDSLILEPLVKQVIEKVGKPKAVAADAAYKTPAITKFLIGKRNDPGFALYPTTDEGWFFPVNMSMYMMNFTTVTCVLPVRSLSIPPPRKRDIVNINHPKHICATCPFLAQCTESKDHQKVITRHIWQEYL